MKLTVLKYGHPVLRQKGERVGSLTPELRQLIADMFETMYAANGVGLAAPQIGISKRLCVIDVTSGEDPNAKLVLANPLIVSTEGETMLEEKAAAGDWGVTVPFFIMRAVHWAIAAASARVWSIPAEPLNRRICGHGPAPLRLSA